MTDFTVRSRGGDSSGRIIWATDFMWSWWRDVCDRLGFLPTITQGAFMVRNGGGASDSAGVHDQGGCFDLRVWDRSPAEVDLMVRVLRERGAAAWRRNPQHGGFDDPHIHFVLGTDEPLSDGAAHQWQMYLQGRDGLASNGPDYEFRPVPLVTKPPEVDVTPEQQEQLDRIEKKLEDIDKVLKRITKSKREIIAAVEDDQ